MRLWKLATTAMVLFTFTAPQAQSGKPPAPKAEPPLDRNNFYAAVQRLRSATDKVLLIPNEPSVKPDRGAEPIKRQEVFQVMGDLFEHYKPKFRSIPRPGRVSKEAVQQRNPVEFRPLVEKLVTWGFVMPECPLVVGPADTLTASQAGDALGFFFNQVVVLTHRAIPKWTPRLQPMDGG